MRTFRKYAFLTSLLWLLKKNTDSNTAIKEPAEIIGRPFAKAQTACIIANGEATDIERQKLQDVTVLSRSFTRLSDPLVQT